MAMWSVRESVQQLAVAVEKLANRLDVIDETYSVMRDRILGCSSA